MIDLPPARTAGAAACDRAALRSAVRLLTRAYRLIRTDKSDARNCFLRAAALLQARQDLLERPTGCLAGAKCVLVPWQMTRVQRFIDANLNLKIGTQDLASLVDLSSSYFARAFRATTGETPRAYLIRRRIERAKELMVETDFSIVQIACDCGFADQPHLTKLFTRIEGLSPGAWRRERISAAKKTCSTSAGEVTSN
jgi:AraC family transcriptional regulator